MSVIITILFTIIVVFVITVFCYYYLENTINTRREQRILKYAKQKGLNVRPNFLGPFKYKDMFQCLNKKTNPRFCNVIEKKNNDTLYIGELQWIIPDSLQVKNNNTEYLEYLENLGIMNNSKNIRYNTMCAIYFKNIRVPYFYLVNKNDSIKLLEKENLLKDKDIDFDNDKRFSEAWWLTGDEKLVRELFTQEVRDGFMKFVDKGYSIEGYEEILIIIASKALEPQEYSKFESDISAISSVLKNNKKFYNK